MLGRKFYVSDTGSFAEPEFDVADVLTDVAEVLNGFAISGFEARKRRPASGPSSLRPMLPPSTPHIQQTAESIRDNIDREMQLCASRMRVLFLLVGFYFPQPHALEADRTTGCRQFGRGEMHANL